MNKKKLSRVLLLFFVTSNLILISLPNGLIPSVKEIGFKSNEIKITGKNAQSSNLSNISNVIVFFNKSLYDERACLNFTNSGGVIKTKWNNTFTSISGFAGTIPTKNITSYQSKIINGTIETNEIVEAQMSYATIQTGAINAAWYLTGYKGNTNSSIAVIDSGINPNQYFFPNGFNQTDLSGNIVEMQNFVEGASAFDDYGHGTFISSVISGTGTDSKESNNPVIVNLHGNLSHEEFFDSLSPQNYSIKIFSFNASKSNSYIFINSSCNYRSDEINGFWFELYKGTNLMNYTQNMTINKYYTINHRIYTIFGTGIYDIYLKYHKVIQKIPLFSFNASVSFYPESYAKNYTYFTGIANATKIVAYKILNQTGIGYTSDLISALASVLHNKSKCHIVGVCLSVGTLGGDVDAINRVINEVIENGTLIVIAAGNAGIKGADPLNKLALNKNAIVVGAINDKDQITSYSSMGKNIGDGVIKPDIVAPGGSKLPDHRSIIAADAKSNKTTAAFGTSIASAIVSAAINILIEARFSNWTEWTKLNLSKWVKIIKATLLMTASETNLQREDDPSTDIDESNFSPTLYSPLSGIGLKDIHEGYGRINIQAAIDALTNYMGANTTVNGSLASSAADPFGPHVFARRITLTANKQYLFNLTNANAAANFDLLLFSNESDQYGEPILLESSRKVYGNFNYLYFTPKENETECVITVKAINGKNTFKLNVSAVINEFTPVLSVPEVPYAGGTKNATVMSNQELLGGEPKYNYTIDRYQFFIKYSDNDASNAPPQEVYVHIVELGLNYSLDIFNARQYLLINLNYSNGVVYASGQVQFEKEGNYSYYFVASDGIHTVTYPETGVLNISIMFPTDSKRFPYIHSFNDGLDDWMYTGTGWKILTQKNSNDDRSRLYLTQWNSIYFGTYNNTPVNYTYQPIMVGDPYPNGTLTSPLFNLTRLNETMRPYAKFGLRVSINSGDSVELQINLNWTGWTTIRTYTNQEIEWFLEEINLTEYIGYYVQFRFVTSLDNNFDPINYKGFILDYFAIENRTNNNPPEIIFDPSLDISPTRDSKFQKVTFSMEYYDSDNNYPKFVYLEMDGVNYTMVNIFGDWNASSNYPGDKGILFVKTLVLDEISNRSFRFHISDGNHVYKTQWYNDNDSIIGFIEPKPSQFNFVKSKKYIGREFSSDSTDDYYISGTPMPKELTSWLLEDNTWHPIVRLGKKYLYGGLGQSYGGSNQGYGTNWDINLITHPLQLASEYKVYLEFYYEINLQNEFGVNEDLLDKCVVSVSKDYGSTWIELKRYTYNSNNLTGNEKLDISEYSSDVVMIKFTLHTNGITTGLGYGWLLRDIYVGYDRSTDFVPPDIKIYNPANNQTVNSMILIEANISDNAALDLARIQIYINDVSVNRSVLDFNNKTGVLKFEWNTLLYDDGTYTIKVVAFDEEGNRAEQSITVLVDNWLINWLKWGPWLIFIISAVGIGITMYFLAEKKGDVWMKRIRDYRAEKVRLNGIEKDQVIKRIELITPEEELKRPLTLYCKFCKSWFSSSDFKIICPVCEHDQLYAAYNCLNCENWFFKEESRENYYCEKCEGVRLVRREKEEVQEILARKGIYLREYEDKSKKLTTILDL